MSPRTLSLLLLLSAPAHASSWFRVGVAHLEVAPERDGRPWDVAGPRTATVRSCCHPGSDIDGAKPDVFVTLSMGGASILTHVADDDLSPSFREHGYFERSGSERLIIKVWDHDPGSDELIGAIEIDPLHPPGKLAFGNVLSMELILDPVATPQESVDLSHLVGEANTQVILAAHQKLFFSGKGKLCWGQSCLVAQPKGELPGVVAFFGDDDHEQTVQLAQLAPLVVGSEGPLRLWVKPAGSGDPKGTLTLTLRWAH